MFFSDPLDAVLFAERQANYNAEAFSILIARDGLVVLSQHDAEQQGRHNSILETISPVGVASEVLRSSAAQRAIDSHKNAKKVSDKVERLKKNPLSVPI